MKTNCLICKSNSNFILSALLLNKYSVKYYKCENCGFIQTESPFWLNEAYTEAITSLDIGMLNRNLSFQNKVEQIIFNNFNYNKKFIDFAGGYGVFVRLMRDKGFDFYRQDKYCDNIFANYFDIKNHEFEEKFELLTAFEVFEHLENPIDTIAEMFTYSDSILFSTIIQPHNEIKSINDWWYFSPDTGQHISFYTIKSLKIIAQEFNAQLFSNNKNLHILTKKKLQSDPFIAKKTGSKKNIFDKISGLINKNNKHIKNTIKLPSKLESDYNYIQSQIKQSSQK